MKAEDIAKELGRIQQSVPEFIKKNILEVVDATPDLRQAVEHALTDDEFPEDKKKGLKALNDLKMFSQKKVVENPKYIKMQEEWINREINKSVKAGRLPKKYQINNDEFIKAIKSKLNEKYVEGKVETGNDKKDDSGVEGCKDTVTDK